MGYNVLSSQSGLSIIATVMVMMLLALFAAIGVSLVTTGTGVGIQEERGLEAFYIADGGLQYAVKTYNFPNFVVNPSVNLGNGSFTATVPTLSALIGAGNPIVITVSPSTDGFILNPGDPANYWIMLCDNDGNDNPTATPNPNLAAATANCEKITSASAAKTTTTFTSNARGLDSSTADTHQQGAVVLSYSWDPAKTARISTRDFARNHYCTAPNRTICVTSTAPFANSGFVRIVNTTLNNIEDVFYTGIGAGAAQCGAGCNACLGYTNPFPAGGNCIRRAYDDNNNTTGTVIHDSSDAGGTYGNQGAPIYQSEISVLATSTGVVPGAILTGNIKRVVQGKIMPLQ